MAERFTIAAAQMTSRDDLSANLAVCRGLAREAAGRGADLLLLPECFAFLGRQEADKFAVAEEIDPARPGPITGCLVEIAREHRMWVIGGGLPERRRGDDPVRRVYNTCAVISPDGELRATYRKMHLFDVDIVAPKGGGAQLRESDSTYGGDEPVVVDTPWATIGLSICYDLRFPELYRRLVERGAEVLVVPAAFTAHTGRAHWHLLLRARAVENQCYVVAAAQWGRHNEKRESYGHALVVDPWGRVVDERPEGDGVVVAAVDPEVIARTRREMPCLQHRRL